MISKPIRWIKRRRVQNRYITWEREPFYEILNEYLPSDANANILDLGSGKGSFPDYFGLANRYINLYLVDGNIESVNKLKARYKKVIHHQIPDKLPFDNNSIDYSHQNKR